MADHRTLSACASLIHLPIKRAFGRAACGRARRRLIETTGRTTGIARRVPVGNGLRGAHVWIVTEHGYGADYVKNIQRQPRMRVKVGHHWHHGTAHILRDDDPLARLHWLQRPVNDGLLLLVGTQQLTIRVDLDR